MISSLEILDFFNRGSRMAVKSVNEDKQTNPTETVDDLMDWKNKIQWAPTIAPVKNNFKKTSRDTLNGVCLNLK